MDLFKFYETAYFNELARRQQIENGLTLPIGAIAAAFGVLGYYFTHFQFAAKLPSLAPLVELTIAIASVLAFALLCISVIWCVRLAISTTYEYLPGTETLRNYHEQLRAWYLAQGKKLVHKADQEFHDYLIEAMSTCSQKNWQKN